MIEEKTKDKGKKMILAALNGPWQTITFLNFYLSNNEVLTSDGLDVVFYDIDSDLEEICRKILLEFNFQKETYNLNTLDQIRHFNFDQIWISKLFSHNPKIILQTFKKPEIILFEEGLHSYTPTKFLSIHQILQTKQKISEILNDLLEYHLNVDKLALKSIYTHLVTRTHFSRCAQKYLLLDISERSANTVLVRNKLPELLEKARSAFSRDLMLPFYQDNRRKKVMVISQYFSYLNVLTYTDEVKTYKQIIKNYLDMGYLVYWKSHPRMDYFERELANEFLNGNLVFINTKLPAEFYSYLYPDVEYIGISSSSLLYKSLIFNGTAYQVAHNIIDKINPKCVYADDFREMYRLIAKLVPANKFIRFDDGNCSE